MKKRFALLTASVMLLFSVAFSQENKPAPEKIIRSFTHDFAGVSNTEWSAAGDNYKAVFWEDGQTFTAFYSVSGELTAVSRKISTLQLPMTLAKGVKNMETGYAIADLFELHTSRGTEYYITYSNNKDTKIFYSSGEIWTTYNVTQS